MYIYAQRVEKADDFVRRSTQLRVQFHRYLQRTTGFFLVVTSGL